MGREEKRPLRRRLEAQKAVGSASLVGASERLQGGSAGPKPSKLCAGVRRVTCATRALRAPGVQLCRCRCQEDASLTMPRCRRQVILPRRVVHTVDERPVVEARAPGSTCSARAVHALCTCSVQTEPGGACAQKGAPGRELRGRASHLNPFSSSEKPRRPTRCSRQRVARASLPIVPGRPNAVE